MIEVDGNYHEGGGQILRSSLALSALTGKPFHISNIRAKRQKSGLHAQHLTGVRAVADLCKAKLIGAELGSKELTFEPKQIEGDNYSWDIGTAGSITLVLQAVMPAALHSGKEFKFTIVGGTNVTYSPPIEYFEHVFCDYMRRMGAKITVEVQRHGFYPKGAGKVSVWVAPSGLRPLFLTERGAFQKIDVWSKASADLKKANVAERQAKGFRHNIGELRTGDVHEDYFETASTGSSIHAHAHFENCRIGAETLGERGKKAEDVGRECAEKLKRELESDSTVDVHMLDQVLPYMGLLGGAVRFKELTPHAETNMWVIEKFLPVKFETKDNVLTCRTKV
jgi:RNA 3'-phosphate cyclase